MRLRAALAFTFIITPAFADMPPRKAGLWEEQTKFSTDGREGAMPSIVQRYCIDAASEQLMKAMGSRLNPDKCRKGEAQRSGNSTTVESSCKTGDVTSTFRRVVTANSDTAYTMITTARREGGPVVPGQPGETLITTEGKWTGDCQADQKPGDMITNGVKTNIRDLPRREGNLY